VVKMAFAPNRVVPVVVYLALDIFANNIGLAQSPVNAQSTVLRIATPTKDRSLDPSRSDVSSERKTLSPIQVQNAAPSTAVFIENLGQFDSKVRYQVKIGRQTAWLTTDGVVFDATRPRESEDLSATFRRALFGDLPGLPSVVLKPTKPAPRTIDRLVFTEDFVGARCCSRVDARRPREGVYNFFLSRDSSTWRTNVHAYSEVVYRDVWPGIDLRLYGNGPDLEQEFIINPGGDFRRVQIAYRGVERLNVESDGSLNVVTTFGELRETSPRIYQQIAGQRVAVDGRFKLTGRWSYSFEVGRHAAEYALVVDPTLLYSTFLGGSGGYYGSSAGETPAGIAVDGAGNAYIAGNTGSADFPTTVGAYSVTPPAASSGFITKLNAAGSGLVYSTYLGGGTIGGIAVDSAGRAFVTGSATSGFPTTPGAYWPTDLLHACSSSDIFVTELNPAGSQLAYSTCFNVAATWYTGAYAIATDGRGNAYIAGQANGLIPTTSGAYQRAASSDTAIAMVVDTTASGTSSLVYSTYLGSGYSAAEGIAVDSFGKFYLTGFSRPGFPTTAGAYQPTHADCPNYGSPYGGPSCFDAFVAKLDPSAAGPQSLIYSTYLGGDGDEIASAIAIDASGNAYVTGAITYPDRNVPFPTTPGAFQAGGGYGFFVTKLNAGGSKLVYSTSRLSG